MATKHKASPIDSAEFNNWWCEVNRILAGSRETEMLYGRAKYWWAYRGSSRLAPCEAARYETEDRQKERAA